MVTLVHHGMISASIKDLAAFAFLSSVLLSASIGICHLIFTHMIKRLGFYAMETVLMIGVFVKYYDWLRGR